MTPDLGIIPYGAAIRVSGHPGAYRLLDRLSDGMVAVVPVAFREAMPRPSLPASTGHAPARVIVRESDIIADPDAGNMV